MAAELKDIEAPALLAPPYMEFDGKRYPWVDEFSNREMLFVTQVLAGEGIDVGEGMPAWAVIIGKLFVSAKRVGVPLTMEEILDGSMISYVGEPDEGDAGPPELSKSSNGAATPAPKPARAKTPGAGGPRT
jgi:hypothetical protein